jgi:hypothetical protein
LLKLLPRRRWQDDFRAADYTSNEVSRLSGFPGHRATLAEQSMELENLELG